MFKQVKSALFWYYLYKFRKRVLLISLLLIVALFANAIYSDIIEYLKLKNRLEFLELALFVKWFIILFNLVFSIYLILTLFKKQENQKEEIKKKTTKKNESKKQKETLSEREKSFLKRKKLKSKADYLLEK